MVSCKKCGKEFQGFEGSFYKDTYSKTGFMKVCKTCDNEYQKKWRESKKVEVKVLTSEVA